jgi:uncharacterized protein (TIGR03086 family)
MSTVSPPTPVAVLDSAVVWTRDCLQLARSSPLSVPTPCRDWDLGALLAHMEDSLETLTQAAELGRVEVAEPPLRPDPDRVVDRLVQRACHARAAWQQRLTSAPISVSDLPLGRDTVVLVGALEVAVHGWDVAQATGHGRRLPEDLAVHLYDVALAVVTPEERGRRFGPAVTVPGTAPASTRLLAHLGREAGWAPHGG